MVDAAKSGQGAHPDAPAPDRPVAMSFRVPPDVQKAIRHGAIDQGVLVQDLIRRAVIDYLEKHGLATDLRKYY